MANMVASLIHTISTHTGDVTSVAATHGKLATTSGDKTVRLWSSEDYSELPCSPLLGHSYIIHYCTFSPLGTILATCSTDGKLILWDVKTGEIRAQFEHESKSSIRVCKFSPDSSRIVSGSEDDKICIWEIATKQLIRSFSGHEDTVQALAYSPDGHFLVSGCPNGDLFVWDAAYGHGRYLSLKIDAHDMGVTCCEFSPTFGSASKTDCLVVNLLLATCGKDHLVKLWTFTAQVGSSEVLLKCHASLPGHSDFVMCCAFSPLGNLLASGSLDKSIRLWNPLKGEALFAIDACHNRIVTSCAFTVDGQYLITGSMDRTVKIWKLTDTTRIMLGLNGYEQPEEQEVHSVSVPHALQGWTVGDVAQWLSALGLEQYQENFKKNAIDGTELFTLTATDLETSLGVSAFGHKNKMLRSRDLGGVIPQVSVAPSTPTTSSDKKAVEPSPSTSVDLTKPSKQWTVDNVVQWLATLGLAEYQDSFRRNAIDGAELFALTTADLETTLGVSALGHRNKMLRSRNPAPQTPQRAVASPAKAASSKAKDSLHGHDEFLCPITMEIMKDPVIAADGYTYDRSAIQAWLENGKDRSPMTNSVLAHKSLTPNRTLKMLIQKDPDRTAK
ncbi:WD repeat, SAM and U-box domain-containing protein 1-like [Littorina saxatilis]|uniref:WD repeat, SAM and U-box domain-containing protein 1 n=1 Tax=Littorina saxatilis TaxID=31220 RepID=A0AAN9ASF3_9CAEN